MKKIICLLKKDITLSASGFLALISAFFVVPDKEYLSYINVPVLVLLFSLMVIVSGFEKTGLFDFVKRKLSSAIRTERTMVFVLCILCFFLSALITNDVALITFVPFTVSLMKKQQSRSIIFCVVMETVCANLGSLLTPIGNPQNLYLYSFYNMSVSEFFRVTLPLGGVCLLFVCSLLIFRRNAPLCSDEHCEKVTVDRKLLCVFSLLFIVCLLAVLHIISCYVVLLLVVVCAFFIDRKLLKDADYILLLTFVFFFIFSGNLARIPFVYDAISRALSINEVVFSSLISQVVSNVPAAAILSSFTDNARALILGTNIGGLGTLIASMASLISFRAIGANKSISKGKYLLSFSLYNFSLLALLLLLFA